jgi:hypothetical protein
VRGVRSWRLALVTVAGLVATGLVVAPKGGSETIDATIGVNALPMRSDTAAYRLTLDGRAVVAPKAPAQYGATAAVSPGGRYRLFIGARIALVDTRTGSRRVLTSSFYPGRAYWGPGGTLAFADRRDGLTLLVVIDPASGKRRVVASHVCGDALVDPWSPDGRTLAIPVSPPGGGCNGDGGSEVAVTDAVHGGMHRIAELHTTPVTWNRDGSRLLINGGSGSRLVDPRTGKGQGGLPSVGSLPGSWSKGRRFYATLGLLPGGNTSALLIVDGSLQHVRYTIAFGAVFAWSPTRQWLAVSDQQRVTVLDAVTGRTVATIPARSPYGLSVWSLTWDRDGNSVVAVAAPALGHD